MRHFISLIRRYDFFISIFYYRLYSNRSCRVEPRTGKPRTGKPRTGEPRTGEPRTGKPRTGKP
jgi:hypothetical protein